MSLDAALDRIGDRWSLLLVEALIGRTLRFGELAAAVPAIAPNILTSRLKRMVRDGLIVATRYSARPPRFDYRLTAAGAQLAATVHQLAEWSAGLDGLASERFHAACGTPIEFRPWCPTCEQSLSDEATEGLIEV